MRRRIEFIVGLAMSLMVTILICLEALHFVDLIEHYLPESVTGWITPKHNFILLLVDFLIMGTAWVEYRYALRKGLSRIVGAKPKAQNPKYEIKFDYLPASPLDNGWVWAYPKIDGKLTVGFPPPESPGAHGLAMTAPYEHAIERTIPPIARKCDELELSIQYGNDAQFYVYANVTSRDGAKHESHWLNIRPGSSEPTQDPSYSKEFVVPVTAQLLGDGWMRMCLRLPLIVASCSGNKGWIFDSADRIRLRGCISVSPIKFFSSAEN